MTKNEAGEKLWVSGKPTSRTVGGVLRQVETSEEAIGVLCEAIIILEDRCDTMLKELVEYKSRYGDVGQMDYLIHEALDARKKRRSNGIF